MEMKVTRDAVFIIPENEEDEAYLEDTLGLKEDGDSPVCKRVNSMRTSSIAYIEITKREGMQDE